MIHRKLAHLIGKEDAVALIEIGIDTPRKIKAASEADLQRAKGIGKSKAKALKARFKTK